MPHGWSSHKERSNPFTLNLICWLALNTSRRFSRIFLYPITAYFFITAPKARKASLNYLNRIYGVPATWWNCARHIFWFASTILDRVYFLTDRIGQFDIKIYGHEILDRYAEKKQGCLLLGAHFGSFDALRSMAINHTKLELKIMMQYDHNAMMMRVLDRLNPNVANAIINLVDDNALLQMKEVLERGEFVGMLADRYNEGKYCKCQLLDSEVKMPTGQLSIASILQVPAVMFFPLYMGDNRYEIYIEELTGPINVERNKRDEAVAELMQKYADRLQFYINKSPLNWFNFYDYWSDEE